MLIHLDEANIVNVHIRRAIIIGLLKPDLIVSDVYLPSVAFFPNLRNPVERQGESERLVLLNPNIHLLMLHHTLLRCHLLMRPGLLLWYCVMRWNVSLLLMWLGVLLWVVGVEILLMWPLWPILRLRIVPRCMLFLEMLRGRMLMLPIFARSI